MRDDRSIEELAKALRFERAFALACWIGDMAAVIAATWPAGKPGKAERRPATATTLHRKTPATGWS